MDADPNLAELGQQLLDLLSSSQTLILFHDDAAQEYCLTVAFRGVPCQRVTVTRASLLEVLVAALGKEAEKKCRRCRKTLRLSHFSRDRGQPDGYNKYCHTCERKRMKRYPR